MKTSGEGEGKEEQRNSTNETCRERRPIMLLSHSSLDHHSIQRHYALFSLPRYVCLVRRDSHCSSPLPSPRLFFLLLPDLPASESAAAAAPLWSALMPVWGGCCRHACCSCFCSYLLRSPAVPMFSRLWYLSTLIRYDILGERSFWCH